MLMITYVETFKIDVIAFISNIIMCLTTQWLIICNIRVLSFRWYWQYHLVRSKERCPKLPINIHNLIQPTIFDGNKHDRYIKLCNCYWMYTWVINCYQINQKTQINIKMAFKRYNILLCSRFRGALSLF